MAHRVIRRVATFRSRLDKSSQTLGRATRSRDRFLLVPLVPIRPGVGTYRPALRANRQGLSLNFLSN